MQITPSNNSNINFNGATRTLKRNYFATAQEIADVFEKHPKSDGIAGSLPYSWLKNIIHLPKEKKSETIKNLYNFFRKTFQRDFSFKSQMREISEEFTNTLRVLKIIPEENKIVIKKRKLDGKVLKGAYIIQERGKTKTLEPLFVKQFVDISGKRSADTEGIMAELSLGLHLHRLTGSEHILHPYFGDTKGRFMVSKYEITPQNVTIPKNLSLADLCSSSSLTEHFEKLREITGDNTDIEALLAKKGFEHRDLHDQNVLITRNQKGNLILKLIDLGKLVRQQN